MSKIIRMKCHTCGVDFTIEPYFHDASIITQTDNLGRQFRRVAQVSARAVCQSCGTVNEHLCECDVYTDDIIALAIRRNERG